MPPKAAEELRTSATLQSMMRQAAAAGVPSAGEERDLIRRAQDGDDDAREQMLVRNSPFVVQVAGEYVGYGLPLEDLVSSGIPGLATAVDKFDLDRPGKFITYAVQWIRQSIRRELSSKSRLIRLPVNRVADLRRWRRWATKESQRQGRWIGVEEIAEHFDVAVSVISACRAATSTPAGVTTMLGGPGEEGEEVQITDILPADDDPSRNVERAEFAERLEALIDSRLTEREAAVIRRHFGLGEREAEQLSDIAADLGVRHQRTSQNKDRALFLLRRAMRFEGWADDAIAAMREGVLS
jgi:RNA polymerase primary sigma factor